MSEPADDAPKQAVPGEVNSADAKFGVKELTSAIGSLLARSSKEELAAAVGHFLAEPPQVPKDGHASLQAARVAVQQEVDYVQKRAAPGLNYKFAGEAEIVGKLHEPMTRHGLTIHPSDMKLLEKEVYNTARGTAMTRVLIAATFTLTHTSGESVTIMTLGEGTDAGDKATYKAMTGAFKYALRQSCLLETGDDPDTTPSDTQARAPQGTRPVSGPQPVQNKAPQKGPPPDFKALLGRAKTGIAGADSEEQLDKVEKHILKLGFPPPMLAELKQLVAARRNDFGPDAQEVPEEPDESDIF